MSSTNPISIVIQLDTNLNLIAGSFVNDTGTGDLVYNRQVELANHTIRLYTVFESIWSDLLESLKDQEIKTILFMVGPHAGFTDSRIIYVWLKSHCMIYPGTALYNLKTVQESDLKDLNKQKLTDYIASAHQQLQYSGEPRIGTQS